MPEKCVADYAPQTFTDCWTMDAGPLNPAPRSWFKRLYRVWAFPRYAMPVYMRLAQYCHARSLKSGTALGRGWWRILQQYYTGRNRSRNHFEVSPECRVGPGVVFHHTGVCITSGTVLESGVHIYRNVTFGSKNGLAPHIHTNARIASHAIVLGGVRVGEHAMVAPGAVVVKDVPDNEVHAGVPARFLKSAASVEAF